MLSERGDKRSERGVGIRKIKNSERRTILVRTEDMVETGASCQVR